MYRQRPLSLPLPSSPVYLSDAINLRPPSVLSPFASLQAWSDGYKEELEKSRLMPTKLLAKLIRESDEKPMAFATIGTIYYYPPSKEPLDERYVHKPGKSSL